MSEEVNPWIQAANQLSESIKAALNQSKTECLVKAQKSCESLQSLQTLSQVPDLSNSEERQLLVKWIQIYSQGILDMTFYDETRLVDTDFPQASAKERLEKLLSQLSSPEELLNPVTEAKPLEILGAELLECIKWRQGALCYMYCATMVNENRLDGNQEYFSQCAERGLKFLQDMIGLRLPASERDFSYHDPQALALLKQGAYSDTHVLAMMYTGELCYWFQQYCPPRTDLDVCSIGKTVLTSFINVVQGPLRGQGWSTDRAKDIMSQLK